MTQDFTEVPVIDFSGLYQAQHTQAKEELAAQVGHACRDVGFFIVTHHNVSMVLIEAMHEAAQRFFALPECEKHRLARHRYNSKNTNRYRGYFPCEVGDPSYKEGFDIGPDLHPSDPRIKAGKPMCELNDWPTEFLLPNWRHVAESYFESMQNLGLTIMRLMAHHLNLPEEYFDGSFQQSMSTLRLLRYPRRKESDPNPLRCSEHTDSGCLTLLAQDTVGGLQVQNGKGDWVDVPPIPGSIVVNLGDLLQYWTQNTFVATPHRVQDCDKERFSIPFFFEPGFDTVLEPLGTQVEGVQKTYGAFLMEKIQEFTEFKEEVVV